LLVVHITTYYKLEPHTKVISFELLILFQAITTQLTISCHRLKYDTKRSVQLKTSQCRTDTFREKSSSIRQINRSEHLWSGVLSHAVNTPTISATMRTGCETHRANIATIS